MNATASKLLDVIDQALTPSPPDPNALARRLVKLAPKPLASPDELQLLRGLQKEHDAARKGLNDAVDRTLLRGRWKEHEARMAKSAREGKLLETEALTFDQFDAQQQAKIDHAKMALGQISTEAQPTCRKIAERLNDLCTDLAAEVEAREKQDCKKFGLPWQPGTLAPQIREAGQSALRVCPTEGPFWNRGPSQFLPYFDL